MNESTSGKTTCFGAEESLVIASRHPPTHYGGLSQYSRGLAYYLHQSHEVHGLFLAECENPSAAVPISEELVWPTLVFNAGATWNAVRAFCLKCASRPFLHPILVRLVSAYWSRPFIKALPEGVRAIHFVGTGWDLFGFALLQVARQRGIRVTVWPAVHPGQWGDDVIDVRFYQAADRIFAQSDFEKAWLVKKGVAEEKITRSGLPPMCLASGDGANFRARHSLSDRPLVLFLGRKDEGKGYPALVEAWKQVLNQFPQACLVAIGPQESTMLTVVGQEQEGILDLGVVSEEDKADALAACDVFCLPSAGESFGIVYLEAWFYSKPVICGTAPACRELIKDGETGLWASQEAALLVESICCLLSDPTLAIKMGARGKQEQMSTYTWDKIGQLHLTEFCRSAR